MNTLESIKNFGRKALVSSLVLSGLATGCTTTPRVEISEKINNNLKVEYITFDRECQGDIHKLIVSDSSGNEIVTVRMLGEPSEIVVYNKNKAIIRESGRSTYIKY